MATRAGWAARKQRESIGKKLGPIAGQIRARDGYRCAYCHSDSIAQAKSGQAMHLDHLQTRVSGGKDKPTNLVVACKRCNDVRHDMTLEAWSQYAHQHLGLKFTPAQIRAQATAPLPDRAQVQRAQQAEYAQIGREHRAAAKAASTPEEKSAHKTAAVVAEMAAQAAKDGHFSAAHAKASRAVSAIAHRGIQRDPRGRFS